jgi:three-Cys-motif partner protein
MVRKSLDWEGGAELEDHTKKKHDVLRRYFRQYLIIRCQLPQQEKFRLAIIDGFSGGGLYDCGSFGSPLIFVEVLINTVKEINLSRVDQGIRPIQVECLLLLNDIEKPVIEQLRNNISPLLAASKDENSNVFIRPEFFSSPFEEIYPQIKERLKSAKCRNVLFNLDQPLSETS